MDKKWFDYTVEDLQNQDKAKQIFKYMLLRLEDFGHCQAVFHTLAEVLFDGDRLE